MHKGEQVGLFRRFSESSWRRGRVAPPSKPTRAPRPRKLNLELLEERALLALSAIGPIDPVNGFPRFYQDANGLALELCLDLAAPDACILEPPNPAAPISFPDNFSPEMFYTRMDATMTTNGGGLALLVGATEAVNEPTPPVIAESFVFGRLRFRVDNLVVGETYTITHPWGVDVFTNVPATVLSRRMINDTTDIGCVPGVTIPGTCDFTVALSPLNKVDTYLMWDPAVAPAVVPGFTGNFFVPHKVIGSRFGTNIFRIEGPNVGGPNSPNPCPDRPGDVNCIQTDLFNVVGKIAVGQIRGVKFEDLNGNGVKDLGEPGLAGWTINLTGVGPALTTTTLADNPATPADETGTYVFPGLDPGTYTVTEVLQPGWTQSAPAGGVHTVPLTVGAIVENKDFGNFRQGAIVGMTFEDLNGNGLKQPNEPGLAGWTVILSGTDGMGNAVNMQTTTLADDPATPANEAGTYSFPNLNPGTYTLSEVLQANWTQTAPKGGTHIVALTSGQSSAAKDFGNVFGGVAVLQADPANPGKSVLRVLGTQGNDKITVSQGATGLSATVNLGKFGPFDPNVVSRIIARGLDGNDSMSISSAIKLPAWLDGGAGNDKLTGGGGRDILVGGVGLDQLRTSNNDDIMIAGRWTGGTTLDALDSALAAIMQEWSSVTPYADRVARLSSGAGGLPVLDSTTVLGDGVVDTLFDGAGLDWFFREPRDKLQNLVKAQKQTITAEG